MKSDKSKKLSIFINPSSGIPVYIQVAEKIRTAVAMGILKVGDKVPSVRELASSIGINPNTVSRAYQKLTNEKVITTNKGIGTFITGPEKTDIDKELKELINLLADRANRLGISSDVILKLLKEEMSKWKVLSG